MNRSAALGAALTAALVVGGSSTLHAQGRPGAPPAPTTTAPLPPAAQPPAGPGASPAPVPGAPTTAPAPTAPTAPTAPPPGAATAPPGYYPPPGGWQGGQPGPQPGPGGYPAAGPGYPTGPGYSGGGAYGPPQGADPNLPGYADAWGWHPGCPAGCGPCKDFPGKLSYHEGQPIPPGYTLDSDPIWGLVIAGLVTTGTLWVFSAAIGLGLEDSEGHAEQSTPYYTREAVHYWPLALPVVGPFVTLGTGDAEGPAISMIVLDGVLQTGGLVLLIAGAAAKQDVLVWNGPQIALRAAPIVVENGAGMGVHAAF